MDQHKREVDGWMDGWMDGSCFVSGDGLTRHVFYGMKREATHAAAWVLGPKRKGKWDWVIIIIIIMMMMMMGLCGGGWLVGWLVGLVGLDGGVEGGWVMIDHDNPNPHHL